MFSYTDSFTHRSRINCSDERQVPNEVEIAVVASSAAVHGNQRVRGEGEGGLGDTEDFKFKNVTKDIINNTSPMIK